MKLVVRTILVAAIFAMATNLLGYWSFNQTMLDRTGQPVAGPATAREFSTNLGQRASQAAQKFNNLASDSSLTAKIKAKMALDDSVSARSIEVSTLAGVVTLTGLVGSAAEHAQALRLAQDTTGIGRVIDRLVVR